MKENIKKGIKTGVIIVGIYILFILYLLFVSNRFEKIENNTNNNSQHCSLKIVE